VVTVLKVDGAELVVLGKPLEKPVGVGVAMPDVDGAGVVGVACVGADAD
jgi:hypothetical protein